MERRVQLARGAAPAPAAAGGVLPAAKLTCAYQGRRIGIGMGQATEYNLAFSNMISLTLSPAGTYVAEGAAGGSPVTVVRCG